MSLNQTIAEWTAYAEGCDLTGPNGNRALLMHEKTPFIVNPMINERMGKERNCNYFMKMFDSQVQPDGQAFDEINNVYHPNYTQKSFSIFNKQQQPCDPMATNACDRHYNEVPSGGRSTMPQGGFFSWGRRTKKYCLQNFRNIPNFMFWLGKEAEDRARTSATDIEMFYLKVFLATAGHKFVLEGKKNASGAFVPYQSTNPRNPLGNFKYNWMQELFPAVDDPNNILPLDVNTLQRLARGWGENSNAAPIAFRGDGAGVYNLWIGDDWRQQEVDQFEDFRNLFGTIANKQMLEGYQFEEGEKTEFSRFLIESRFNLPRFAVDEVDGGIVMVQDMVAIDAEVGEEYIRNPQWMDAPFRLAVSPTRDQATILTRPLMSVHGNGAPIPVVPAFSGWEVENEYDKECNPERLLPHWKCWNEAGFRPKNPDGSMAIMYRAREIQNAPTNYCNLAPLFTVASPEIESGFINIGCENKQQVSNSITQMEIGKFDVRCTAQVMGDPTIYRVTMEHLQPLFPNGGAIPCAAGSDVRVIIEDVDGAGEGTFTEVTATIIDDEWASTYGQYYIKLPSALGSDKCIRALRCIDSTPNKGTVSSSIDVGSGVVKYALESMLVGAALTNDVIVTFRNSAGTSLGTFTGTITAMNPSRYQYTVTSAGTGFASFPTTGYAATIDHTKTTVELD